MSLLWCRDGVRVDKKISGAATYEMRRYFNCKFLFPHTHAHTHTQKRERQGRKRKGRENEKRGKERRERERRESEKREKEKERKERERGKEKEREREREYYIYLTHFELGMMVGVRMLRVSITGIAKFMKCSLAAVMEVCLDVSQKTESGLANYCRNLVMNNWKGSPEM
ncbi:hypothetical protein TNCV_3854481 [Trichonephila clavipes]|nr:hypothetical protein TNCV_3854481 [Trichonephila clavipes]